MDRFEPKLSWNSLKDDLVEEFYRPALKDATLYQRKAGFFSSTTFMEITNEIVSMIKKNGRIQLITSPKLSSADIEIIEKRQGLKIGCVEEIAYNCKYINKDQLLNLTKGIEKSEYGKYLLNIIKEDIK